MNKLILVHILSFVCAFSIAQTKKQSIHTDKIIDTKWLIGKWRSDNDKNAVLKFNKSYCYQIDLADSSATCQTFYKLSTSCNIKDSCNKINLDSTYLIFYSGDSSFSQCNVILNLNQQVLSLMDNDNGNISVFHKIK